MVLGIFKIAVRLRDRHVFYKIISESFKRFQYFNFETNFLENDNLFLKIGVPFLVETSKTENTSFSFKNALSKVYVKKNRMETYHKDWSFASNHFIFLENLF